MGNVIFFGVMALIILVAGIVVCLHLFSEDSTILGIGAGILALVLTAGSAGAAIFFSQSEGFKRDLSAWQAEHNEGLEREITIYSEGGEVIYEEEGRFSVDHSDDKINWVDEEGNAKYIYLGRSSTAVVNEIGGK